MRCTREVSEKTLGSDGFFSEGRLKLGPMVFALPRPYTLNGARGKGGIKTMKLKDIMTQKIEFIGPDAFLQEAAEKMAKFNVGVLPVCDEGHLPFGILTDRDIIVRAMAKNLDLKQTRVRDIMTPEVTTCQADTKIKDAAKLMEEKQLRRLLIVDPEQGGKIIGICSLGDLVLHTHNDKLAGEILEKVSRH